MRNRVRFQLCKARWYHVMFVGLGQVASGWWSLLTLGRGSADFALSAARQVALWQMDRQKKVLDKLGRAG